MLGIKKSIKIYSYQASGLFDSLFGKQGDFPPVLNSVQYSGNLPFQQNYAPIVVGNREKIRTG